MVVVGPVLVVDGQLVVVVKVDLVVIVEATLVVVGAEWKNL